MVVNDRMVPRLATEADIKQILHLLRLTPYPPNLQRDNILSFMEEKDDFIVVNMLSCVRMHMYPDEAKFVAVWWLWDGTNRKAWLQCMEFSLAEIRRRYGVITDTWFGGGEFSGAGDTKDERFVNAKMVADAALPGHGTIGVTGKVRPILMSDAVAIIERQLL